MLYAVNSQILCSLYKLVPVLISVQTLFLIFSISCNFGFVALVCAHLLYIYYVALVFKKYSRFSLLFFLYNYKRVFFACWPVCGQCLFT